MSIIPISLILGWKYFFKDETHGSDLVQNGRNERKIRGPMNEEGKEDPSIEGSSSEPMSKYK
jgi:hypothetical protein